MNISYVLFGATGNLAQIKIVPALCALFEKNESNTDVKIISIGRRDWGDDEYRDFIRPSLSKFDEKVVGEFLLNISFINGTFEDSVLYEKIKLEVEGCDVYFHLAVLPSTYSDIIKGLGKSGLKGRLLIEKPFGNSLESAESLENLIESFFEEKDIFRIDHYLGKKGLQEMIRAKEENKFISKFNAESISDIICRSREVIDINGRGEFYDKTGAFLDVGQNHMLEIVASLLMDSPGDINNNRAKVLESIRYIERSLIRGQYEGYCDEVGSLESKTETYFRCSLQSDLPQFAGVLIAIEGGKALEENNKVEGVVIRYNDGTEDVFNIDTPKGYNAYETVIDAAIRNDMTYFVSKREMFALWRVADEVISHMNEVPLVYYKKGKGPDLII